MSGVDSSEDLGFVEVDPTGRYGRYNEILGKGASKTVYRAFDEYEGIEVAWNQVKLNDFLQSPEDLERLYCEIHLLKTLKHRNIMKFYTSWVDTVNRNINFVTEMFTSGTLRQYRMKHRRTSTRAIKRWCRQILQGLLYLHSHDPPVIHRDLKCDNIFINGHQGEVKIGDLGLAAILRNSHVARCVGTPEFMAPEVYEEEYNELVDIYSFGMCILEMMTLEYPYSECSHPAQIYKKVISGKKPAALYKVKDPEVRSFVEKCLASASDRLSAWELLNDSFLQIDDHAYDSAPLNCLAEYNQTGVFLRQPRLSEYQHHASSLVNCYSNYICYEQEHALDHSYEYEATEMDLFTNQEDNPAENVDISIRGRRNKDVGIFLRLRIADKEGHVRNIHFPFDTETDTALSVAAEMVAELDITDQDVTKIAEMIDGEITALLPQWRCVDMEESPGLGGSITGCVSSDRPCLPMQRLFEDKIYQSEDPDKCVAEDVPEGLSQSDRVCKSAQIKDCESTFQVPGYNHFDHGHETVKQSEAAKDYKSEVKEELKSSNSDSKECTKDHPLLISRTAKGNEYEFGTRSFTGGKHFTALPPLSSEKNGNHQKLYSCKSTYGACSPVHMGTATSFYSSVLIPHRATTLPVDATDF